MKISNKELIELNNLAKIMHENKEDLKSGRNFNKFYNNLSKKYKFDIFKFTINENNGEIYKY